MMTFELLTEEQKTEYKKAINTLFQLVATGEQLMTIHQLCHEFGETIFLDQDTKKVGFLDFIQNLYDSRKPIWFMKYIKEKV